MSANTLEERGLYMDATGDIRVMPLEMLRERNGPAAKAATAKNSSKGDNIRAKYRHLQKRRGPAAWLEAIAEATGYSRFYLSRAINGRVKGPVLLAIEEARQRGMIPQPESAE